MPESQQTTIINLHNSGIPPEIIALQLDISLEEVSRVIASVEEKPTTGASEQPSLASFYLDAVVDLDKAVKLAQKRVWKALKVESRFDLSTEETRAILTKHAKSKIRLVILYIDLVGSTRMSSTLPA